MTQGYVATKQPDRYMEGRKISFSIVLHLVVDYDCSYKVSFKSTFFREFIFCLSLKIFQNGADTATLSVLGTDF